MSSQNSKRSLVEIEDVVDMSSSVIEFITDIVESSLNPIVEYSLGFIPVVKDIYSVYKRHEFERKIHKVINEMQNRQQRLESIISKKNDRIEFGRHFIKYLDYILFYEHNKEKIKYYCELIVSSYERKNYSFHESDFLNILMSLSFEEISTIFKIKEYVVKELDAEHMVDILTIEHIREDERKDPFYSVLEDTWFFPGMNSANLYNCESHFKRLESFGLIEPRYGYYGNELKVARWVIKKWAFEFCDFIEIYSGKKEDSFLMVSGKSYESKKYPGRVKFNW
ncbi:hypothetical protein DVV95_11195 [Clostridium botulinum]|uniref:hypothetical protein n=1 Tax=Clostridium botulinum TaxID=1491 RepID=UPI000A1750F2|nr:hypothetical protein [Clostridium botulinum]MBN1062379.1 hypothetical protein [Clostridium botulinum]